MIARTFTLLAFALVNGALAQSPEVRPAPPAFVEGQAADVGDMGSFEDYPAQVQVTVEFIETSAVEATRLLYREKLGKDGTKLRSALLAGVDEGAATVFETMFLTTRSGQKGTTESIREVIYPTEWEPTVPMTDPNKEPGVRPPLTAALAPATPTAFTTRNVGSTLEVEPILGDDNQVIDLRLVPEIVFEAGQNVWNRRKDEIGNELRIEEPYFYALRTTTSITMMDGVPQLLSVLTPMNADHSPDRSRKLFVIVTSDVVHAKPAAK